MNMLDPCDKMGKSTVFAVPTNRPKARLLSQPQQMKHLLCLHEVTSRYNYTNKQRKAPAQQKQAETVNKVHDLHVTKYCQRSKKAPQRTPELSTFKTRSESLVYTVSHNLTAKK